MTKPDISSIAPFFIVKNVPAALSFYRDRLGFDITFQGPDPEDIFFGIVHLTDFRSGRCPHKG
jgi:catechol 2,3-dioxygenase-like lactoylglutathione lyase family enzyme